MTAPFPVSAALPQAVLHDMTARPIITLQEYLHQFTDARGALMLADSCAQVMIQDGRLPAYKPQGSEGVWLVRADEAFPDGTVRPPLTNPEFITLIEWGARHGKDRHGVHEWRKRGHLHDADMYQSRQKWLIRATTPAPILLGRHPAKH